MAKKYSTSVLKVKDDDGNVIPVPALKGKSAYEYAVDGGYAGTEAEFGEMMAGGDKGSDKNIVTNAVGTTFPPTQKPADSRIDGSDVYVNLYVENDSVLPADSATSDDIHAYIDGIANDHPESVTKEILGKDESGCFDIARYTVCNREHIAWQEENHPKMYAWKNGEGILYSTNISPRIGDTLYIEKHTGGTGTTTETTPATAVLIKGYRYSQSGGKFNTGAVSSIVVPITSSGTGQVFNIALSNDTLSTSFTGIYYGNDKATFPNTATGNLNESYGSSVFTVTNVQEGDWYIVFFIASKDDYTGAGITVDGKALNIIITDTPDDSSKAEFGKVQETTTESGYPVTAVSATNRSRTANGLEYVRYEGGDVEPTLIYTDVYDDRNSNAAITKDGTTYNRYPLGDLLANKIKPIPIFIFANEHGTRNIDAISTGTNETKLCALVASRLIRDLGLGKQSKNPLYKYIRENCMLIVIPVVNVYGFNHYMTDVTKYDYDSYRNSNSVNINRNYDCPGWDVMNESESYWMGEYPGSENETQYVMNTMVESGAVVAMSLHGLGGMLNTCRHQGQNPGGVDYNQDKLAKVNDIIYKNYGLRLLYYDYVDGEPARCVNTPDITSKSPSFITQCGAYGGIVEFQPVKAGGLMGEQYLDSDVVECAYVQTLNLLAMWLSDYLENK